MNKFKKGIFYCLMLSSSSAVWATQGAHLVGYGAKAQAMGGASVAYPQDAITAANNPAGMSLIGNQLDIDVQIIYPTARLEFGDSSNEIKGDIIVPIPEFGINYNLSPKITLGLSTAARGVAFDYDKPVLPVPGLLRPAGNLAQVDLMPTITYKASSNLALGLSPIIAYQQFEAQGIPGPFPTGQNPAHGREDAWGLGLSVGLLWQPSDILALGLSYKPKLKMGKLDNYKDDLFFTSRGSIDSPESYKIGASYKINEKLDLAMDIEHLKWSEVPAYYDLFGWRDQTIVKSGVNYQYSDTLSLSSGISLARKHITNDKLAANFLLPGINSNSLTVGMSKKIDDLNEFTIVGEYSFGSNMKGTNESAGTYLDAEMYILTLGYSRKF